MSASLDLARRAVACKGWRRMSGMLGADGWRVFDVGIREDGAAWADLVEVSSGDQRFHIGEWLPDLDDPATLGCLIFELLPEAWGDPWFSIIADADGRWRCVGSIDYHGLYGYETRKEALVAALEAAP